MISRAPLELLDEAERLYASDYYPDVRPISAMKARLWIMQGKLDDALDWARERGLSAGDDLSYLREFEHITLARVLLARSKRDRADGSLREGAELLERLLLAAEAGQRTRSVIEILVLQALDHQRQGDLPAALVPLERALTLAEPEGYRPHLRGRGRADDDPAGGGRQSTASPRRTSIDCWRRSAMPRAAGAATRRWSSR